MTGKNDEQVVEERRYYLDQFLKGIGSMPYLAGCLEIQIFLRPRTGVEKDFKLLEKITTTEVYRYYMIKLPLQNTPDNYGESIINNYN
jgi:hypothetical protein